MHRLLRLQEFSPLLSLRSFSFLPRKPFTRHPIGMSFYMSPSEMKDYLLTIIERYLAFESEYILILLFSDLILRKEGI